MSQIYIDCDGVIADFDSYAEKIFGLPPRKAEKELGAERFWVDLRSHDDFYFKLLLMPDAMILFDALRHLNPIILTGCPHGGWAEDQKQRWAAKYFPGTKMICCKSAEKRLHMKPGDILVDDWPQYRHLWDKAGDIFILHTDAKTMLQKLENIGILDRPCPNCGLGIDTNGDGDCLMCSTGTCCERN